MTRVTFDISMSLDGYVAGPDQSVDNPLGVGGEQLHEWVVGLAAWREPHGLEGGDTDSPSNAVMRDTLAGNGAVIIGRNMFGGGPGPWDEANPWNGWWGDEPPFHVPVFVLTHHAREPLELRGGTTFHFVTEGPEAAVAAAREAAGGRRGSGGGGAQPAQQLLVLGAIDEVQIHLVPITLGGGARLFDNVGDLRLEPIRVIDTPQVTHLRYRVVR